jgi:hypothetical protein
MTLSFKKKHVSLKGSACAVDFQRTAWPSQSTGPNELQPEKQTQTCSLPKKDLASLVILIINV